jgi:hypothetical protein
LAQASTAQFALGVASAAPQTWTFTYDGPQVQHFTVPNGVTQLSAIVSGAAGGQTNDQIATPGGGGGGWSTATVSAAVSDIAFLSGGPGAPNFGVAPGLNGSVVLTTNKVQGFTARANSFNPPAGTTQMTVYLEGASGGNRVKTVAPLNSALGSPGGSSKATFPFLPSQQPYFVFIGLYGSQHGGGGYSAGGDQGQVGGASNGFDGGGGGGSSGRGRWRRWRGWRRKYRWRRRDFLRWEWCARH